MKALVTLFILAGLTLTVYNALNGSVIAAFAAGGLTAMFLIGFGVAVAVMAGRLQKGQDATGRLIGLMEQQARAQQQSGPQYYSAPYQPGLLPSGNKTGVVFEDGVFKELD